MIKFFNNLPKFIKGDKHKNFQEDVEHFLNHIKTSEIFPYDDLNETNTRFKPNPDPNLD